jgi:hypothetical protein
MVNVFFVTTRWNGYNLYWSQIVKLFQITFSEHIKINQIFIPEQIIKNSNNKKEETLEFKGYEKYKQLFEKQKIDNDLLKTYIFHKFGSNENFKINTFRKNQIDELLKIFSNTKKDKLNNSIKKNSQLGTFSAFENNFSFIMHYLTGGRLGLQPAEITLLKDTTPVFGFGPIFHINYDNFYYYTLFSGGYFSLSFFILGLIIIIYYIFKNKMLVKKNLFTVSYLMIFLLFLVSSIGAPSYLLNTAVIYFYLPTAIILFKKKAFDEFN